MNQPQPQAQQWTDERRHETTDVGVGLIAKFIVVFAVIILISMPLLWWMLQYFKSRAEISDPQIPPLADSRPAPPEPHLQASPAFDFKQFKRQQLDRLESTGWVDPQQKIVHIPIERAMQLVLEEGLPKSTGSAQTNGAQRPAADDRQPSVPAAEDKGQRPVTDEQPAAPMDDRGETDTRPEIPPVADEVQP